MSPNVSFEEYSDAEKKGLKCLLGILNVSRETLGGNTQNDVSRETWQGETAERFVIYARLLAQWQERMNLVAPSTLPQMWTRHFADSLAFFTAMPRKKKWVDMGSGAGFPGLVIAIMLAGEPHENQNASVDIIESHEKKCGFLREVVRTTEIHDYVRIHHDRVENILPTLQSPDVITARALAPLEVLLKMSYSHLSEKSCGLFAKGEKYKEEVENARKIWNFEIEIVPSPTNPQAAMLKIDNLSFKK